MPIYRANVRITHPVLPDPGINTWHVRLESADPNVGDMVGLSAALHDFYDAMLTDCLAQGAQFAYDGVLTKVDPSPTFHDTANTWTAGNAGSSATLPPANCIVIGWGTQNASRKGRGRSFMGPIQQAANDASGTISTAALASARDAAADLVAANAGPPAGAWGVYSRADGVIRDFTSSRVHDKFAVLRSRRD